MSAEIVRLPDKIDRRWRKSVPDSHRGSLDERIKWMWNQRFGTIQTIYIESNDLLDRTAAILILQAIMARDLRSIQQVFQRLEGGARHDDAVIEDELTI